MQLRIIRGWVWSIFARLEFGAAKAGPAAVLATALWCEKYVPLVKHKLEVIILGGQRIDQKRKKGEKRED